MRQRGGGQKQWTEKKLVLMHFARHFQSPKVQLVRAKVIIKFWSTERVQESNTLKKVGEEKEVLQNRILLEDEGFAKRSKIYLRKVHE